MVKGDIVLVEWMDPQTNAGWFEELEELTVVQTVGLFIKEDDQTLWLGSSYHEGHGMFCDQLIFPKGSISKVVVINY